jgi:hypothetical protein
MEFANKSDFEMLVARVAELEKMALPVAVVAKKPAAAVAKKPVVAVAKPAVAGGEEPEASSYRLTETDASLCQARKEPPMTALSEGWDKRYTPSVFYERQCSKKPTEGSNLCATCAKLLEKEESDGAFKKWHGLITEEPLAHSHMAGTEWFASKAKWGGGEPSPPKAKSAEKSAEKAAAAAVKAEEKAAKAAKKAEEKAAKEVKKAEEKAAKKEAKKGPKAKKPAEEVVAVAEAPTVNADGEMLNFCDGEIRWVKNGNCYEVNELTQEPGDFVGRLTGNAEDGWDVDGEAEEELESDTE